jgi:hypothetical protein
VNRTSTEKEKKIIELWFEGKTGKYISETLGISEANVSDIINSLPKCLREAREIAVACKKHNKTLSDALAGINVSILLSAVGVNPQQIPSFIRVIKKTSAETEHQPEHIIQAALELSDLEDQSEKKYSDAINEFKTAIGSKEKLSKENERSIKENLQLRLEVEKNRRLRSEALKRAKTTHQELSELLNCKTTFFRYGMDINDAEIVRKGLDNINEAGGNTKHLVSLIKKHDSIAKLVAYLERQLPQEQNDLENLHFQIKEMQQIIYQLKEQKSQLEQTIIWQKNAISYNNYQLNLIRTNVAELEKRKDALINWIGKTLSLPQETIEYLRFNSNCEIALAIIVNEMNKYIKSHYGQP